MPPLSLTQTIRFLSSRIRRCACLQHLAHVPPVHADEVDRAVELCAARLAKAEERNA